LRHKALPIAQAISLRETIAKGRNHQFFRCRVTGCEYKRGSEVAKQPRRPISKGAQSAKGPFHV